MSSRSTPTCTITVALAALFLGRSSLAEELGVVILAGQSNMVGLGVTRELPPELRAAQADVPLNALYWSTGWVALRPGFGYEFGPEITFGRHLADLRILDTPGLINFAVGGTSLAVDWDPDTGSLYPLLVEGVSDAFQALRDQGLRPRVDALLWMQGESDALDSSWAGAYRTNLTNFIARVRADLHAPDMPFILGRINAPGFPYRDVVRRAQELVAADVAGVKMILTDDLALHDDNLHYNTEGLMGMGYRFAVAANDVDCAAIHKFTVKCRDGKLVGKVRSTLPGGTGLTVDRDGEGLAVLTVGPDGRGKVVFPNQSHVHVLTLLECPERIRAAGCG